MKADLLLRERHQLRSDAFAELRIWRTPESVRGSGHRFKYSLAHVVAEVCVLRYDNEAGKGDHKHRGDVESPYPFTTPEQLLAVLARCRSMETLVNSVTLSVASRSDVGRRIAAAFRGEAQGAHISFASVDLLWRTLTKKRWEILRAMTGEGEMSIREVARRVGRDVKAVHGDVTALVQAGILERSEAGVVFPYDEVRVDFTFTKAA